MRKEENQPENPPKPWGGQPPLIRVRRLKKTLPFREKYRVIEDQVGRNRWSLPKEKENI